MKEESLKIFVYLLLCAIIYTAGYCVGKGKKEISTETEIKYIQGDTIEKVIYKPEPYLKKDTIIREIPIPTDTSALYAVWKDYYQKRDYVLDFSEDTIGTFKINASVNENKLIYASSTISPIIRTITKKEVLNKAKTNKFYAIIGSSVNLEDNQIQLGIDFKEKYLLGVSWIRLDNKNGYTINAGVKF